MHPSAYIRSGWNLLDFIIVIVGYFVFFCCFTSLLFHDCPLSLMIVLSVQLVQCDSWKHDRSQAWRGPSCCRETRRPGCQSSQGVQGVTTASARIWSAKCVQHYVVIFARVFLHSIIKCVFVRFADCVELHHESHGPPFAHRYAGHVRHHHLRHHRFGAFHRQDAQDVLLHQHRSTSVHKRVLKKVSKIPYHNQELCSWKLPMLTLKYLIFTSHVKSNMRMASSKNSYWPIWWISQLW